MSTYYESVDITEKLYQSTLEPTLTSLFNAGTMKPDIAVIELERPFTINDYVKPACVPREDIAPNTVCYTSGWGVEDIQIPMTVPKYAHDSNNYT